MTLGDFLLAAIVVVLVVAVARVIFRRPLSDPFDVDDEP